MINLYDHFNWIGYLSYLYWASAGSFSPFKKKQKQVKVNLQVADRAH